MTPVDGAPPPAPGARVRRRKAGSTLGEPLKGAILVWVLLLATSGAYGVALNLGAPNTPALLLSVLAVDAAIVFLACRRDRDTLQPCLADHGLTRRTWWYPLAALAGLFAFMSAYLALLELLRVEPLEVLSDSREFGWPAGSEYLLTCLYPAVVEELAFRGFIFGRLRRVMKPTEALVVQAAMFSVLHLLPLSFVSHFVMGLVLGLLRVRMRSLWPPIAVHFLWNAWFVTEAILAS